MKIKERNTMNSLYEEIRYNKNTLGTHKNIRKGNPDLDKRHCAVLSIFSLMTSCGYYDQAEKQLSEKKPSNIVNQMLNNSERMIDHTFIKDEEVGVVR